MTKPGTAQRHRPLAPRPSLAAAHDHATALVEIHDVKRDQLERIDRVHALTRRGYSANEIALQVGITQRQVVRDRSAVLPPDPPKLPDPRQISDQRAADMESLAAFVLTLVSELRDEDPAKVFLTLRQLPYRVLLEFTMVALAMIPDDKSRDELLDWVAELPAAQESDCA